jgi:O-acetylhomoserine (thiol)-lyase
VFEDTEHAASLFNLEVPGHIYSRISNPTVSVFEQRIAALEGGVAAVATASGQAAAHRHHDADGPRRPHRLLVRRVRGTVNLLINTLPRFGITTTFVDPRDHAALDAAITDDTRLVIGETIGNPVMNVLDLPAVADIAHAPGCRS